MIVRKLILTPERVEEARLIYEAGAVPLDEIAAMLGYTRSGFLAFRRRQGWKPRRPFNYPEEAAEAGAPMPAGPARSVTPDDLIPKIEAALNREFAHIEHAIAHGHPRDAEKTAKTMASLVRSLAELKRVQRDAQGHGTHNDAAGEPPARDLAELKAELARRLDRLKRARDAERGS